jgi:hypothetical protein
MKYALLLTSLLISCSQFDREECKTVDWVELGREQARLGRPYRTVENFKTICDKYDIKVNEIMFRDGYNQGVKTYCSYHNGYELGVTNKDYHNICPKDLEYEFLMGYNKGKRDRK